jgi:hypothetical protein
MVLQLSPSTAHSPTEQDVFASAYLGRAIAAGTTAESYEIRIMGDDSSRDVGALRQMLGIYQRRSGH